MGTLRISQRESILTLEASLSSQVCTVTRLHFQYSQGTWARYDVCTFIFLLKRIGIEVICSADFFFFNFVTSKWRCFVGILRLNPKGGYPRSWPVSLCADVANACRSSRVIMCWYCIICCSFCLTQGKMWVPAPSPRSFKVQIVTKIQAHFNRIWHIWYLPIQKSILNCEACCLL